MTPQLIALLCCGAYLAVTVLLMAALTVSGRISQQEERRNAN